MASVFGESGLALAAAGGVIGLASLVGRNTIAGATGVSFPSDAVTAGVATGFIVIGTAHMLANR